MSTPGITITESTTTVEVDDRGTLVPLTVEDTAVDIIEVGVAGPAGAAGADGAAGPPGDSALGYTVESAPDVDPVATGTDALAAGDGAVASGAQSVAFGVGATAAQTGSVVIGPGSAVLGGGAGYDSMLIGKNAQAYAQAIRSVGIGYGVIVQNSSSVVIGAQADSGTFDSVIVIGSFATVGSQGGVAIGYSASAAGSNSLAIGKSADAQSTSSLAIGNFTTAAVGATAIGTGSNASVAAQATGNLAVAIGSQTLASGVASVAVGQLAKAPGETGSALGAQCEANALRAIAVGFDNVAGHVSAMAVGDRANTFAASQLVTGLLHDTAFREARTHHTASTTTTTPTEMFAVDGTRYVLPASTAHIFEAIVLATQTGGVLGTVGDTKAWKFTGAIKRDAANNTTFIGSTTKTVLAEDSNATTWDVSVAADDTNEALAFTVTGQLLKTIKWFVEIKSLVR